MRKVIAETRDGLRRYPRAVILLFGVVLITGFRPFLVARVAAGRIAVQRTQPKAAAPAAHHKRADSANSGDDFAEPLIDPVQQDEEAQASSSMGTTSSTTTVTSYSSSTTGTTGTTGTGGGGSSGCTSLLITSSSTSCSYMSLNVASLNANEFTACDGAGAFGGCTPVGEDVRGSWRFRSTCSSVSCDSRAAVGNDRSYVSATLGFLRSLRNSASTGEPVGVRSVRCTREMAGSHACIVLDSARIADTR